MTRSFASDNSSGVHPDVLAAIAAVNVDHDTAYGDDATTAQLQRTISTLLGHDVEVLPVFNGTGANVTALEAMQPRWGGVICAESAHINVDEGGAPERVGGMKLLAVETPDGKLTPDLVAHHAHSFGDVHRAQPAVLSITQSTELGTVYTPDEIRALADDAHDLGLTVHLDGARLANACATLGTSLRELTVDAGIDVFSLGATKNGAMGAEAIVVVNADAAKGVDYLRKTNMQLASKMRFMSAQLIAMFGTDLWLTNAQHANAMAARLRAGLEGFVEFTQETQANAVFARLEVAKAEKARKKYGFYNWNEPIDGIAEVRLMCSFDTTPEEVDDLVNLLR